MDYNLPSDSCSHNEVLFGIIDVTPIQRSPTDGSCVSFGLLYYTKFGLYQVGHHHLYCHCISPLIEFPITGYLFHKSFPSSSPLSTVIISNINDIPTPITYIIYHNIITVIDRIDQMVQSSSFFFKDHIKCYNHHRSKIKINHHPYMRIPTSGTRRDPITTYQEPTSKSYQYLVSGSFRGSSIGHRRSECTLNGTQFYLSIEIPNSALLIVNTNNIPSNLHLFGIIHRIMQYFHHHHHSYQYLLLLLRTSSSQSNIIHHGIDQVLLTIWKG